MSQLESEPEIPPLEVKRKLHAMGFAFALGGNPGLVQHEPVLKSKSKFGSIISLMFCRILLTVSVETELVSRISKRDLGGSDAAGREEEEGMAGHCTVTQPGEVNHSWVRGSRRSRGTSPFMGNHNW